MITRIEINGFKSFVDFQMEFTPLTVIAGTNGSGKSNLFDALHLLSNLSRMDLRSSFSSKYLRGEAAELFTKFGDGLTADEMSFAVEMLVPRRIRDNWGGEAEVKTPRMRYVIKIQKQKNALGFETLAVAYEQLSRIETDDDRWCKQFLGNRTDIWKSSKRGGSGKPYIYTETEKGHPTIRIRQDGGQGGRSVLANAVNQTVLGSINSVDFPHVYAARQEIARWNFMQLNPEILREPTRYDANYSGDTIGHSGENLAAALNRLKQSDPFNLEKIVMKLSSFLPNYTRLDVKDDTANKQFVINLQSADGKTFSSRLLSEGTLRLMVLCILLYDDHFQGLLCFEEPENGIHPFRIQAMAELLKLLATDFNDEDILLRQVIVNTHSPLLLKFLRNEEQDSKDGVSIWFSRLVSRTVTLGDRRTSIRASKLTPLSPSLQYSFTMEENKMTIADAEKYLSGGV